MSTDNFLLGEPSSTLALTSPAQVDAVVDAMFRQAKRSLLVRAARLDFNWFRANDLMLLLAPLIKGDLRNQVCFLIEDTNYFMNHQPRIIQLARSFSSYVKVRKVSAEYTGNTELFIVADQIGYVHQTAERKFPVRAAPYAPAQAKPLARRFKESWEHGQEIAELQTAGL